MILHDLIEGRMKDIDIEYQDYLNSRGRNAMTNTKFLKAYGMTRADWAKRNRQWIQDKERMPTVPDAHLFNEDRRRFKGPHGVVNIDQSKPGVTRVTRHSDVGAKSFGNKDYGPPSGIGVASGPGVSATQGSRRTYPRFNVDGPESNKSLEEQDMASIEENNCARTKAAHCACKSVKQLTEDKTTVTAVCVLEHSDRVKGTILLKQQPGEPTLIVGQITGLEPGLHGFHIHEFGDLSRGCESAGAHYNPDAVDHGDIAVGHVGDLGNVTADQQGRANFSIVAERVDLAGDRSVVGRAIVVHSDPDDLGQGGNAESLKTGNAGDRLACGVITMKETVSEGESALERFRRASDQREKKHNDIETKRKEAAKQGKENMSGAIDRLEKQLGSPPIAREGARVARKPGQPVNSKKHSDLYTDENPRGTITGLKFATPEDARASVTRIRRSGRSHAHKIQAAVAMEQRAKAAGKAESAAVYRRYINANKKTDEQISEGMPFDQCPQCGGPIVHVSMINEKQDACYHKVKSRYKVWPSAYASGALVQCRKKGAANWGNKSESVVENLEYTLAEDLKQWFKQKWVRFGPDGKIRGPCARGSSKEGKPKCLPKAKAQALGKKGRAAAGAKKRRQDPDANRRGAAKNVATKVREQDTGKNIANPVKALEQDLLYPTGYDAIDHMMQTIARQSNITGKRLHDLFVKKHGQTPDDWIQSQGITEQQLNEKCWKGYHREGNKKMFGKTYPNCVKNKS